jgi:hypothetical protein
LQVESVAWSAQQIPTAIILDFLDPTVTTNHKILVSIMANSHLKTEEQTDVTEQIAFEKPVVAQLVKKFPAFYMYSLLTAIGLMPGGSVYKDHTCNEETAHTSHENIPV